MRRSGSCLCILAGAILIPTTLLGDGGTLQFRQQAAGFVVSVFSSPVPLQAGRADLSVLVQNAAEGEPVLNASVTLNIANDETDAIRVEATRAAATNKLLYAAPVTFPHAGKWRVNVYLNAHGKRAHVAGAIQVWPERAPWITHWPYFAAVPTVIFLFAINQWLKKKRRIKHLQAPPWQRSAR